MTYKELLTKLSTYEGPCMRLCAYCPEDFNTKEVKECVEWLVETMYKLQADKDLLLEELIKIRKAYKDVTGNEYRDD